MLFWSKIIKAIPFLLQVILVVVIVALFAFWDPFGIFIPTKLKLEDTPVDDRPGALNFCACVGHHGKDFIVVRYGEQFTVFTEESWLIERTAVAGDQDFIIRELDVVVLFVVHHNTLGTHRREALAVEHTEGAYDGAFVAHGIKVAQVCCMRKAFLAHKVVIRIETAVVEYRRHAV